MKTVEQHKTNINPHVSNLYHLKSAWSIYLIYSENLFIWLICSDMRLIQHKKFRPSIVHASYLILFLLLHLRSLFLDSRRRSRSRSRSRERRRRDRSRSRSRERRRRRSRSRSRERTERRSGKIRPKRYARLCPWIIYHSIVIL